MNKNILEIACELSFDNKKPFCHYECYLPNPKVYRYIRTKPEISGTIQNILYQTRNANASITLQFLQFVRRNYIITHGFWYTQSATRSQMEINFSDNRESFYTFLDMFAKYGILY